MKTVNDIRSEFLGFFEKQGHTIVESSPLVPQNDPSLMFVNSGMVQFKDVFTGKDKRDYTRATTSQKCVRAGGKHNDLENVGYTARHHTFFEMLGNFSFGDYFKQDAIAFAWELVTKNFALPADKLCVTVHSTDEEAAAIWKKVSGLRDDKIIRISTDDNFWRMGDTGPCGPCTEIFYDHGDHIWGGPPGSAEEDGDRFIEIWNNVFMQYEQIDADTRIDLPAQSVDTGMGLERIAATLMGSHDNYQIDIMQSLIHHVADETGVSATGDMAASHKVIADHIRAVSFLMADGVMPSNEGRGYVLRRIMRRGMRHAHLLGAQDPLMYKLFPTLLSKMGKAYPELGRAQSLITETLKSEEQRFKVTLERGLKMLDEETEKLNAGKFPGDIAFKLYDTFGFPLDLTQDALRAKNIEVDTDAFDTCMNAQKTAARAAWSGSGDATTEKVYFEILEKHGSTEFLGYETEEAEGQVLAIVKDGKLVDQIVGYDGGFVVTNQTPFYAESGGQIGDTGEFKNLTKENNENLILEVKATVKRCKGLHVHHIMPKNSRPDEVVLKLGDAVQMKVDHTRRTAIRANHSATHLMHEALRRVLGDHVSQKGSLQDENRTRFDISHPKGVSADEIAKVEALVNEQIKANTEITTRLMPIEEARETGAMALFGEKYDDEVRVIAMGTTSSSPSPLTGEGRGGGAPNKQFSIELCGGTHAGRTGEIEKFKITSEGALSSGIRRIEAVTGARVDQYEQSKQASANAELTRLKDENEKLEKEFLELSGNEWIIDTKDDDKDGLIANIKALKKQNTDQRRAQATKNIGTSDDDIKTINGIKFIGRVLKDASAKDLKPMADDLKKKLGSGVVVLIATGEGKASIVVGVTNDLTNTLKAIDLVKIGSEALGGKGGGGRPDMAQAGGPNADKAEQGIEVIEKALVV